MADATFEGYTGIGYSKFGGGGELRPNDFHGLAGILLTDDNDDERENTPSSDVIRKLGSQLRYLRDHNPAVKECLTCIERDLANNEDDAFPAGAEGPSPLPTMPEPHRIYDGEDDGNDDPIGTANPSSSRGQKRKTTTTTAPGRRIIDVIQYLSHVYKKRKLCWCDVPVVYRYR